MSNRLELTWIGKYEERNIEPRILVEDKEKSYGEKNTENMLIHGDNLIALKSLESNYSGRIKCIYIDPPYNTGSAFEHYDDNVEHSIWLNLMNERLKSLRKLLTEDGIIWINLDDNETHYCKVMCDEIFGRKNFLCDVIWEKADSPKMDAKTFSSRTDHILVYSKNIDKITIKKLHVEEIPKHYNKIDENGNAYYLKPLRAMGVDGFREKRPALFFPVEAPDGELVYPKNQDGSDSRWRWSKDKVEKEKDRLEWIKGKNGWSLYFKIFFEDSEGIPPETLWKCEDVGSNRNAKKEVKDLFGLDAFSTPKPEKLIKRVIEISSNEGDYILDSFLGSGTTCAVAHKMNRKYIGIELEDNCYKFCKTRLDKVIDGEQGGISKMLKWKGGGGYRFFELAPTLINKDCFGEPIINSEYNAEMLASAVALHEGFKYEPDKNYFWKQSKGNEDSYLYVTTNFIDENIINSIRNELKENEYLIIACTSYDKKIKNLYKNIVIKKIPEMLLNKCEFGINEYNLNIINPPEYDYESELEDYE